MVNQCDAVVMSGHVVQCYVLSVRLCVLDSVSVEIFLVAVVVQSQYSDETHRLFILAP